MSDTASTLRIALFGAGLIGQRHAHLLARHDGVELAAIIDPTDAGAVLAEQLSVPHRSDADAFLAQAGCNAAVLATPNATHRPLALACIAAGLPVLVEKPLADTSADARAVERAANAAGVPVLVGHHRRHHAATKAMRSAIDEGALGKIVAARCTWMLRKPDAYFQTGLWRQSAGGGPVWINLIHEIDLLCCMLGPVAEVAAFTANEARGAAVEDCAAITLRFADGALATAIVSDATPSPFHFEGASGENPNIAPTGMDGLCIFGTSASVSFPSLKMYRHEIPDGGWGDALVPLRLADPVEMDGEVALAAQLSHFVDVARGEAKPIVSAGDGAHSVAVCEAILMSARTGRKIVVGDGT